MKYAVLGTGDVGKSIATKLIALGHEVKMGSRTSQHPGATEWAAAQGQSASHGSFAEAAVFGDVLIVAVAGTSALSALKSAGSAVNGKIVIDVSNPLDFSQGFPPSLLISNTDSLAEQLQSAFPAAKVVKTLNTTSHLVMVNPALVPGDSDVFVSGNDAAAKAQVVALLKSFGWKAPMDLGDISTARGTEMMLPIWVRLYGVLGQPIFNFKIVR